MQISMAQPPDCEPTDVAAKIERALKKLSVRDIKDHALRLLPGVDRSSLVELLHEARQEPTPRVFAAAIYHLLVDSGAELAQLWEQFLNIKLLVSGLSGLISWSVYELQAEEASSPDDVSFSSLAGRVGRALRVGVRCVRGAGGAELLQAGPHTCLSLHRQHGCVLVSGRTSTQQINTIAQALGYSRARDCHLSGRHVPSLLQLMEQLRGAVHHSAVLSSEPPFSTEPHFLPIGVNFSVCGQAAAHLGQQLGPQPPRLESLTVQAEVGALKTTATLSSPHVACSLQDMVRAGILRHDSVFVDMLHQKKRNHINIRYNT